ncbi:CFT1 [Enterospora canceri]|uniref:CFT1 n=1 Tax=Enterospora canceri TaxID=1081671 RepID=A0A1Y1S8Y6_9MICR|nr:CFT1 [Enterospora canceri]
MNQDVIVIKYDYMIKIYTVGFVFLRQKHFYDRITDISMDGEMLVVLLGNKIIQCSLQFESIALRELNEPFFSIECYDGLCIVTNKKTVAHFKLRKKQIAVNTITGDIIKQVRFYPSTILMCKNTRLQLLNIDGKMTLLEEYELLAVPILIESLDKCIVVIYRHGLEVIYKSNRFLYRLCNLFYNDARFESKTEPDCCSSGKKKRIEVKLLGENSTKKDITHYTAEFSEFKVIFESIKCVQTADEILLINGNGDTYRLIIDIDVNIIRNVELKFIEKRPEPTAVAYCKTGYVIACKKDYLVGVSNGVRSELRHLGNLHTIEIRPNRLIYYTEDVGLVHEKSIKLDNHIPYHTECSDIKEDDGELYYYSRNQWVLYDGNQTDKKFRGNETKSGNLFDSEGEYEIEAESNRIKLSKSNRVVFIIWIEDMNSMIKTDEKAARSSIEIEQILLKKYKETLNVFLVVDGFLYIYRLNGEYLEKQFVEELIYFQNTIKTDQTYMFKCNRFIYTKSIVPYFIFVENEIIYTKSRMPYDKIIQVKEEVFYTVRNRLGATNENKIQYERLCDMEVKTVPKFRYRGIEEANSSEVAKKKFVGAKYSRQLNLVNCVIGFNYIIGVGVARDCYRNVPVVPVVHRQTDDNKTVTERINPYIEDNRTAVMGSTLRFSLILYNQNRQFIESVPLDENEYVVDTKIILEHFVLVAVTSVETEDRVAKSRLILYQIVSIVSNKNEPGKNIKLKYITHEITKYATHSIDIFYKQIHKEKHTLNDILVCVGVGTRLMVYEVSYDEFTAVGRMEVGISTVSIQVLRNLVLLGDMFNGMQLHFMRPDNPLKLSELATTNAIRDIQCVYTVVDNHDVLFTCVTKMGEIYGFKYEPEETNTFKGTRLVKQFAIDTKIGGVAHTAQRCNENYTVINNTIFMIKEVGNYDKLYGVICDVLDNTMELNAEDCMEMNELLTNVPEMVYQKNVLLEYQNMSHQDRATVESRLQMSRVKIVDNLADLMDE